jgi:hypothetical protein
MAEVADAVAGALADVFGREKVESAQAPASHYHT